MKACTLLILLSIFVFAYAENPGLVAVVEEPIINKVRDQYFTSVFEALGTITLDEFEEGAIKAHNIRVEVSNDDPENLQVGFDAKNNSILVDIQKTFVNVKVDYSYKLGLVNVKGTADIQGPLDDLNLSVKLSKEEIDGFIIPNIAIPKISLNMKKSDFKVKLTCKGCLPPVESLITTFMKGTLLSKVETQIKTQVPEMADEIGNGILRTSYPRTFPLFQDIEIVTALTDVINITDGHIEIPIDATVFTAEQGIVRPGPTPEMPRFNPENPGEIQMFFSSYLADTLTSTLNSLEKLVIKKRFLFLFNIITTIDPSKGRTSVGFDDGALVVSVTPRITTKILKLGVEASATVKVQLNIKGGDKNNLLTVVPKISKLNLNSFKVIIFGLPINLSLFKFLITPFARIFLNLIGLPKIPIPKSDLLPLTVKDSLLQFNKNYAEFGILFDFE